MTLLMTALTMIAFAAVYAGLVAMLGNRAGALLAALSGGRPQPAGATAVAASRRFNLA